jgi:hypothetical protein
MKKQFLRRILSLTLSAAMLGSVSITTANASSNTNANSARWSGAGTEASPYLISSQADLEAINTGLVDNDGYEGKYFKLTQSIALTGNWTPIGGDRSYASGDLGGTAFKGNFDGGYLEDGKLKTYTISGLTINRTADDVGTGSYGGFGLFGYVDGGTIQNVTVSGSITSTANDSCVGGIVGYTTGGIYNCHNQVTISITNADASQVGGIAGTVENTNSSGTRYVQYCSNTAAITGRSRIGGIVGAVYCSGAGGVIVDNCYNLGNLTNNSTTTRAYVGGIVGFCRGYIQNCYSICTLTAASSGHYMAGLVGILQGSDPQAKLSNSYTVPVFRNATIAQDHWAFASADRSNDLPISGVLWCTDVNTSEGGTDRISQETADGDNGWGAWTRCGSVTENVLSDYGSVTVYTTNTDGTIGSTTSTVSVQNVLGDKFAKASGTSQNGGYPVLTWQNDGLTYSSFTPGSDGTAITADAFYLSSSGNDDYDGTSAQTPVRTLSRAIGLANATTKDTATIYVMDPISLDSASIYGNAYTDTDGNVGNKVTVAKASSFTGSTDAMFTVPNGNTVYLGGINFDGAGFTTTFDVSGTLYIRSQACVSGSNTAFNVTSTGSLTLNRSDITGSQYSVKVATGGYFEIGVASTQTFSMSGTIYLGKDTQIVFSDPVLCDLTVEAADAAVGRVIAVGDGYTLTQTDADHVYDANDDYGVLEMLYTTTNTTELILAQRRYLDGTKTTNSNGTLASPYNNLASALSGITAYQMIIVTGTSPLTASTYSGSTTIQRGPDLTGPMFTVASGVSTMLSWKTITDRGQGTIVQVNGGSLTLAGGVELCHCNIAVEVVSGSVDLSQTILEGQNYSIYMGADSGTLSMSAVAVTSITGPIYLSSGKTITTDRALVCDLAVQCAEPATDVVVLECSGNYKLTQSDASRVSYANRNYGIRLNDNNQLVLFRYLYLDGTKTTNGDGSYASPYNTLTAAITGVTYSSDIIRVIGITALSGNYDAAVTVQRDESLTGSMFSVSGTATLGSMIIDGNGGGTIATVNSGTLSLGSGVTLTNCDVAVDVLGGTLTFTLAFIDAAQYSVRLTGSDAVFNLNPVSGGGAKISGTVYLATGKYISVGTPLVRLAAPVTIECESPSVGTVVASKTRGTFTSSDEVGMIVYLDSAYGIAIASGSSNKELELTAPTTK